MSRGSASCYVSGAWLTMAGACAFPSVESGDMSIDQIGLFVGVLLLLQIALTGTLVFHTLRRKQASNDARHNFMEITRAARLALAGEITSSVAHRVAQPLSAILNNVEAADMLLRQSQPDLEAVREILADVRKDDLRANKIVDGLRLLL